MKTENEAYKGVKRDKLIYELERYKKAVQTRDLIIEKMRDEMYGQYQVGQILAGYIAILAGTDEREINKETVREAVGKYKVNIKDSEDKEAYIIQAVELKEEVAADESIPSED